MQAFLRPFAGIIGIAAYLLLIAGIMKSKVRQSFVAFLLWAMLDAIATITTILKEGNYWLSLSNALGAAIVAILLALKKQVSWTWVETTTAILVIICLNVWYFAGATEGIIVSSLAMVIASVPQMRDTYNNPEETPTTVYSIFLAANILSFIGGKEWTIEDRFYSGCAVFLCAVIVIFSLKNTLKIKQRQPS